MSDSRHTFIVDKSTVGHWRVTLDNPPINVIDDGMYDAFYDSWVRLKSMRLLRWLRSKAQIPIFLSRTMARRDRAAALGYRAGLMRRQGLPIAVC